MTNDDLKDRTSGPLAGSPTGYGSLLATEWYVRFAQFHDRMGRPANAEAGYRRALARRPLRLDALAGLGRLLLRGRRYEEAVEIWAKAVRLSPESPGLAFQLSRALHRSGRAEQAAAQYLRVVALAPAHEKALAALEDLAGRLARAAPPAENRDGLEKAARIGQQLLALHPTSPRVRASAVTMAQTISAAASALVPRAPEAALAHYSAALALAPDMLDALRGAALCLERLGRYGEALAILDRQMQVNPQAVEPRLQSERIRGSLEGPAAGQALLPDPQEREGIRARARRLITAEVGEAAPLDPQEREAILARARRLIAGEPGEPVSPDPHEREAVLARARRLARGLASDANDAPKRSSGKAAIEQLLQSARSAYNDGRLEEAENLYQEILRQDGANLRALSGLSQLFMRQRRWAAAIEALVRLNIFQPNAAEPKQLLARALLQDGQVEAAIRVYVDLSILDPADLGVWRSLAQANNRLGDWAAARAAWMRVLELAPDVPESRLELAWACYQAGDGETAQAELQGVLARDPDHRGALAMLGRIRLATDPDGALGCWSRLVELDPAAVEPPLQVARIHLRQQRLEHAEAGFRAVVERQPGHAEALASLAGVIAQRDPEEAVNVLGRWSERDPTAVAPWIAIGRLYARLKRLEPAESAFGRALDLAPSNLEALTGLGRVHTIAGKVDEALAVWSRLVELAPALVEPKLQIARIRRARNDPETEEALRAVLSVDPQNREALRHLAQLLGRTRATVNAALDIWQRLAELDPGVVFPIAQRGRLLERFGRLDEAEAEYRRALACDGRHSMALGDLARFYRVQRRWDDAAEIYRAHMALDPDRLDVILGLGQCLDRRDRLQEAEELYSRALALDPDNVTALGYRGRLLRTRGQVDGAIADFYRICELEPSNADAWHELIFQLAGAERESEALDVLAKAEQALGDTPEAWMVLARAAAAALFEQRAIAYFERAIAAEPANPTYHAQLGLHYLRQGVLDGAFHHLLDSRDLDPKNVDVAKGLFNASRALRELGFDHVAMRGGRRTVGEILVPERLFEHVRRVAERIMPYEPVPRSVVAISATLAPGGAERQMVNMLRGLSDPAFGLDLTLFCISLAPRLRRNFFLPVLEGTGVDVVSLDAVATEDCMWHPDVAPFAELIRHFPSDIVTPIAFWLQEFRRRRPEVVHAWQDSTNLAAVVAALLAGVPRIVLCCRSVRPDNPRRRLRRFMKKAYEAVLAHPAVVLSNNSRAGANDYAEWLGMAPERIEVVYNGVDFDRLRANAEETDNARRDLGIPAGAPVLGGVFRMSEEKRPLLWIDVAAAVARRDETVHFVICGDGPMRDEMVNHAAALGIGDRVHLPGAQANIGSWYRMMDVVMLTSRHEGLPNVLLEAQSLGIPVVAPDVGGMSEVVEQGVTGWTVRDADAESLAERVQHCLSNWAWRQAAGERAPVFVRDRFSIPAMLRRNLEVYGIPPDLAASDDR
ncbi:tetratricopeptide repeat protein [Reyranella sp.]|uniref:tetratricopeptide repeat protein n=1 Tax=Reyranella sp. TaxID=1929291 RepID=UPI00272FBD1E|nr:tetratricopeptide repeat protein [Reyranella sp.]MDP2372351.1 tetratricopeptide repeat protein [Reyranella sp.]